MSGLRLCLIFALVVGATPVATAADYTVPAGVTILTEEQLLTYIIGSTFIVGTSYNDTQAQTDAGSQWF